MKDYSKNDLKITINNFINYIGMDWLKSWLPEDWRITENNDNIHDSSENTINDETNLDNNETTNMSDDNNENAKMSVNNNETSVNDYASDLSTTDLEEEEDLYVKIPKIPRLKKGYYRIRFENSDEPGIDYVSLSSKDVFMQIENIVKDMVNKNK